MLAFGGQHAFALGTAMALAERSRSYCRCLSWPDLGERWPSRLVATASQNPVRKKLAAVVAGDQKGGKQSSSTLCQAPLRKAARIAPQNECHQRSRPKFRRTGTSPGSVCQKVSAASGVTASAPAPVLFRLARRRVLHLEPVAGAPGGIARAQTLADDALEPEFAGVAENDVA